MKDLQKQAAKADHVYLATDPDREGEAISWHLAQELGLDEDSSDRVTFHEITKNAVTEAFANPRAIDMDLVHSQETRRILDRIIGFKLSKLLNNKIKSKSAGRVQSVALKLIVEREKEIQAFVPRNTGRWMPYSPRTARSSQLPWQRSTEKRRNCTMKKKLKAYKHARVSLRLQRSRPPSADAQALRRSSPSTLQQEASTKLGFAAKRTMSIAQRLYEGIDIGSGQEGLITYMRTDSTRLSECVHQCRPANKIEPEYGKEYRQLYMCTMTPMPRMPMKQSVRPILPMTPEKIKPYLTSEQYSLYKMIYARALASLMAPANMMPGLSR